MKTQQQKDRKRRKVDVMCLNLSEFAFQSTVFFKNSTFSFYHCLCFYLSVSLSHLSSQVYVCLHVCDLRDETHNRIHPASQWRTPSSHSYCTFFPMNIFINKLSTALRYCTHRVTKLCCSPHNFIHILLKIHVCDITKQQKSEMEGYFYSINSQKFSQSMYL